MAETNIVDSPEAQQAFLADVPTPTETLTTPVAKAEAPATSNYTEEDLKRVREQEKSKLYPQIDSLKEELTSLKKARIPSLKSSFPTRTISSCSTMFQELSWQTSDKTGRY